MVLFYVSRILNQLIPLKLNEVLVGVLVHGSEIVVLISHETGC